jgi:hypothetical protein
MRPAETLIDEARSTYELAEDARRDFRAVKRRQLARVAAELATPRTAIAAMRRAYVRLQGAYLAIRCTTYAAWETHGPLEEWAEVTEAARHDHAWERLVDRGLAPWARDRDLG